MILPDRKYQGTIKNTMVPDVEPGKHPHLLVTIETPDGDIDHRLYLSVAARQHTEKVLLELGVEADWLVSPEFWETPGKWMNGRHCSIETEEDEYEGKKRVRVKWLNGPKREVKPMPVERARGLASLFVKPTYNAPTIPATGGDDEPPF